MCAVVPPCGGSSDKVYPSRVSEFLPRSTGTCCSTHKTSQSILPGSTCLAFFGTTPSRRMIDLPSALIPVTTRRPFFVVLGCFAMALKGINEAKKGATQQSDKKCFRLYLDT